VDDDNKLRLRHYRVVIQQLRLSGAASYSLFHWATVYRVESNISNYTRHHDQRHKRSLLTS